MKVCMWADYAVGVYYHTIRQTQRFQGEEKLLLSVLVLALFCMMNISNMQIYLPAR